MNRILAVAVCLVLGLSMTVPSAQGGLDNVMGQIQSSIDNTVTGASCLLECEACEAPNQAAWIACMVGTGAGIVICILAGGCD